MTVPQQNQHSIHQRIRRMPLGVKILLLIFFCLTLGFGGYVIYSLNSETDALLKQHRQRSHLFSETLISGIRNIMLSGRAPYVRAFIMEAREEFDEVGEIHLFNNKAEEIYPPKNPHIAIPIKDENLIKSLNQKTYSDNFHPLINEKSCQACHADGAEIRGTIKLDFTQDTDWEKALVEVVNSAFQAIMLSGKGEFADTLLLEINSLIGVKLAQVYDQDVSFVYFGDDDIEVDEEILDTIHDKFHKNNDYRSLQKQAGYYFSPMPNLGACTICHSPDSDLRGVLAMEMQTDKIKKEQVVHSAIIGFKNLMRLQKASYAGAYIDAIRKLPFVENFQVFDNGELADIGFQELWVPNPDYDIISLDSTVGTLIASNNVINYSNIIRNEYRENIADVQHLTQMIPIMNNEKCQACHGPPVKDSPLYESQKDKWKVRSVVKVSSSMADIHEEISKIKQASILVGLITFAMVTLLMRIFMRITVLKPLDIIGGVADKIGAGDLSVNARVKSQDEIGILAQRINAMIKGLQERLHLTKFVSEEAVSAVKLAGLEGLDLGGERRETTIMETDIRGFTSMSEKMEPEEVVSLLNIYLDKQTEIVRNHGGDIDKFVGDAILASFMGDKMADNAVRCALNIQIEMKKLNKELEGDTMFGIGINTGPVIMGPIGGRDRMDYTVIGDHVNLACRLCDAAEPGEIIISSNTEKHLTVNQFKLKKLDPVSVKGKKKTIEIFQVIIESEKKEVTKSSHRI